MTFLNKETMGSNEQAKINGIPVNVLDSAIYFAKKDNSLNNSTLEYYGESIEIYINGRLVKISNKVAVCEEDCVGNRVYNHLISIHWNTHTNTVCLVFDEDCDNRCISIDLEDCTAGYANTLYSVYEDDEMCETIIDATYTEDYDCKHITFSLYNGCDEYDISVAFLVAMAWELTSKLVVRESYENIVVNHIHPLSFFKEQIEPDLLELCSVEEKEMYLKAWELSLNRGVVLLDLKNNEHKELISVLCNNIQEVTHEMYKGLSTCTLYELADFEDFEVHEEILEYIEVNLYD